MAMGNQNKQIYFSKVRRVRERAAMSSKVLPSILNGQLRVEEWHCAIELDTCPTVSEAFVYKYKYKKQYKYKQQYKYRVFFSLVPP